MQWSQEHVHWPEQYLDVSSTTPSPAHKTDANRLARQRHQYPWAHDDISALTASNLLKKYAEKYSGLGVEGGGVSGGEGAYERAELNPYGEGPFGAPVNGQKLEGDGWQMSLGAEGPYSVSSLHHHHHHHQQQQQQQHHHDEQDLKPAPGTSLAPGEGLGGHGHGGLVGASPSNVTDPRYPPNPNANPCGPPPPSAVPAGVGVSADYSSGYNGSYMSSGYCGQPGTPLAPPHPSPLHTSGLLQPVHPTPTLVSGFNPGPMYSYPTNSYPTQPTMGPAYSGGHPVASYLPSAIAAPTPLAPTPSLPGYSYQSHSLAAASGSLLKRKVFELTSELEEEEGSGGRYKRYGYAQARAPSGPGAYQMPEDGGPDIEFARGAGGGVGGVGVRVGEGGEAGEAIQGDFKPSKRILIEVGKYRGQEKKDLMVSPSYGGGGGDGESPLLSNRADESYGKFPPSPLNGERPGGEPALGRQLRMSASAQAQASQLEEQLKSLEPGLLELVSSQIVDRGPPVRWGDVAGLGGAKAVIEEQVLWPLTRPGAYTGARGPPKSFLLFGPRGGSKTVLTRCVAAQLGATYLKINASSFVSKWKAEEAEKILQAAFLVARSRQPSVLFVNELEAILSGPGSAAAASPGAGGDEATSAASAPSGRLGSIKAKFLSQVEGLANSGSDRVVVIGGTRRPGDLEEGTHRYFAKRLYISPPDRLARSQVLGYGLSQREHCLSEAEIDSIVQRTDGYSGNDLVQLCRQAAASAASSSSSSSLAQASGLTGQPPPLGYKDFEVAFREVPPSVSQKELELYLQWSKLFGSSTRE